MKINLEIDGDDPRAHALLLAIAGAMAPVDLAPPDEDMKALLAKAKASAEEQAKAEAAGMAEEAAAKVAAAEAKAAKAAAAAAKAAAEVEAAAAAKAEAKAKVEAASAAKNARGTPDPDEDDQPTPPKEKATHASAPATGGADTEVTLATLQDLASGLLQAGERRTFKAILDEHDVKSLSSAPVELYPVLHASLVEAVSGLTGA